MQKVEKDSQPKKLTIIPLRNQKSFDIVNKIGNKLHGNKMIMICCQAEEPLLITPDSSSSIYLGLKISKKLGNAVIRNKIRRRIKSIIHSMARITEAPIWANKALIIVPRKGFHLANYSSLEEELLILLHKTSA